MMHGGLDITLFPFCSAECSAVQFDGKGYLQNYRALWCCGTVALVLSSLMVVMPFLRRKEKRYCITYKTHQTVTITLWLPYPRWN
jgi:hypothetical protein